MLNLQIHDNFFPPKEIDTINQLLFRPKWSFNGGGSTENKEFYSYFWHMDNLEQEEYFGQILWEFIRRQTFGYDKKCKLLRCYANGQTAGQSGVPHKDDGDTTVLYFPTPWKHYYGGHLYFTQNDNITNIVEYKQNRLITFSANVEHYSGAPIRTYNGLRISLAFKVKLL